MNENYRGHLDIFSDIHCITYHSKILIELPIEIIINILNHAIVFMIKKLSMDDIPTDEIWNKESLIILNKLFDWINKGISSYPELENILYDVKLLNELRINIDIRLNDIEKYLYTKNNKDVEMIDINSLRTIKSYHIKNFKTAMGKRRSGHEYSNFCNEMAVIYKKYDLYRTL